MSDKATFVIACLCVSPLGIIVVPVVLVAWALYELWAFVSAGIKRAP